MTLFKVFMFMALGAILIYQQVLIIDLRWQVAELRQNKPALYLVETSTGRELKLEEIE